MSTKLIVGLQNPGPSYHLTRHNAGGWLVAALAQDYRATFSLEKKWHAEVAQLDVAGTLLICVIPTTYMNNSGLAVRAVSQFYKIASQDIVVAHDELDLPAGKIKLKSAGGHGGHNGLRDIITQISSADFLRLRIGIGHPGHKDLVLDYVLGKPNANDKQLITQAIEKTILAMPTLAMGNLSQAMNLINA